MSEVPRISSRAILETIDRYYTDRIEQFGPTPRGVDWNSAESQELRFSRLLDVVSVDDSSGISLLDVGCGYAALLDYLRGHGIAAEYRGFDVSDAMIEVARKRHASTPSCVLSTELAALPPATHAVASGIFNVKLDCPVARWREYAVETLELLHAHSARGFAFNMLSTYSDVERRRDDLFYADPCEMFDLCKRRFSPRVALLHDYPLFEFTIIVRK